MIKVNTTHFCGLSTAPAFLAWLHANAPDICESLVEHGRNSRSCLENTKKMMWVLGEVAKRPDVEAGMFAMLASRFPNAVVADRTSVLARRSDVPVFGYYDPALLTVPRRAILASERAAREFLSDKPAGEYVVVDGVAYVEYLTDDMVGLRDSIPERNWLIRRFKSAPSKI